MQACTSARCQPPAVLGRRCSQRQALAGAPARRSVVRFAFEPDDIPEGPGVATLLEKDRPKVADVNADELLAAFADDTPSSPSSSSTSAAAAAAAKPGLQREEEEEEAEEAAPRGGRQRGPASKRADKLRQEDDTPKRAREAIDSGLQAYQAGDFRRALDLFQLSLELPGCGFMRLAGSPKEYACASEGEENAALYNMACCWAAMGQKQSALTVLEALLDNNFTDFQAIRSDPDLAPLRGPELDKLLAKHDGLVAKLFGGGKKKQSSSNKPWLQW